MQKTIEKLAKIKKIGSKRHCGITAKIMKIIGKNSTTRKSELIGNDLLNYWRTENYLRGKQKTLNLIPTTCVMNSYNEICMKKYSIC